MDGRQRADYLERLADAFGDPRRRAVYRHLREAGEPLTASEVAARFGVHRTVARAHLERLAELGLVETGTRRRAGGGRPAKTYRATAVAVEAVVPARRYERLARLLLELVEREVGGARAKGVARALGREQGERAAAAAAAAGEPPRLPPGEVVRLLNEAGYEARLAADGRAPVIEIRNCVYRELAARYPDVVCSFDQGMLLGMLGASPESYRRTSALCQGDPVCRHEFRL